MRPLSLLLLVLLSGCDAMKSCADSENAARVRIWRSGYDDCAAKCRSVGAVVSAYGLSTTECACGPRPEVSK